MEDREEIETRTSSWERKYSEIVGHFTNILHMEDVGSGTAEALSAKVSLVLKSSSPYGKLAPM